MRRLGYHVSIAGGLSTATLEAKALTCNTIQIFLGPPHTWKFSNFTPEDIEQFNRERKQLDIDPVVVHAAYLPNPASADDKLWNVSVHYLISLSKKASEVGANGIHFHLGSNPSREGGVERLSEALRKMEEEIPKNGVTIVLETDAGPGNHVGDNFEEIQEALSYVKDPSRFGVTIDTCHIFVAGYDIRTEKGVYETIEKFDQTIGLKYLHTIHANDSKGELGSHLDRHEHIGEGKIGLAGFKALLNHPKLKEVPFILETPQTGDTEDDLKDIKTLRKLIKNG